MLKLISSNDNKLNEFRRLSTQEFCIEKGVDLAEVDADDVTVAIYKSKDAGENTIIEDTILIVDGEPVVDIKFKLSELNEIGESKPAQWKTTLAVNADGYIRLYDGVVKGIVVPAAIPKDAFGFDANFIPDGECVSLYELEMQGNKDLHSARKIALEALDSGTHSHEVLLSDVPDWNGHYQGDSFEVILERCASRVYDEIDSQLTEEWKILFQTLKEGKIPEYFPHQHAINDMSNLRLETPRDRSSIVDMMEKQKLNFMTKELVNTYGMFGIISKAGAQYLVEKHKGCRFIDPIAGRGWMAKALREAGAEVVAGDLYASQISPITDVVESDAEALIDEYGSTCDILLLSWAPYDDNIDYKCALKWGTDKPILVYGEFNGCCNSKDFCNIFSTVEFCDDFPDLSYKPLTHISLRLGKIS